ncbi:WecB/TagA/CpsF family glycosyltransferase [Prolixibacteraceae bacterium Z1-6]|uniref:WecB/TagA/CpsF family glycosyltransferase n=1 Tax=Draconibacterium aestuarii TaxID=2998507 RepID=A0A9X3F9T2_9BACT|nr:WecB/TagA/CpsF family glycosyltransferase [Prolixibacteraceae bacterium Z1-6]
MEKYFKIQFEFDHKKLEQTIIETSEKGKGYCCFIDSNMLIEAHKKRDNEILDILNNSLINSCDGSYIAKFASLIYHKSLKSYNGPQFFNKFILHPVKHCIVGNTDNVFQKIKRKVERSHKDSELHFIPLPYMEPNQFDYISIARHINTIQPRYIWISLGAPKQEIFMSKLLPHLNSGVMLGVGAALNYFSGDIRDIPHWITKLNLIWIYRIFTEPKKQLSRVCKIIRYYPRIFFLENSET